MGLDATDIDCIEYFSVGTSWKAATWRTRKKMGVETGWTQLSISPTDGPC